MAGKPVGLFKEIPSRGTPRRRAAVPATPDNTVRFSGISTKYQQAVLDEIGRALRRHAEGGARRAAARSPAGTSRRLRRSRFHHQPNATGETRKVCAAGSRDASADDELFRASTPTSWRTAAGRRDPQFPRRQGPELRICAGPLTTQTARAFLPENKVITKYVDDLSGCAQAVADGQADVIMNPLPDLEIGGVDGYLSVPTMIVAGTPFWVAKEGIECPDDGDPRTEDRCFETDPP